MLQVGKAAHRTASFKSGNPTTLALTRRHFLQVGKAAQRIALGTRATQCLPNALAPLDP
ncbi:MAG: hypothetical protein RMY34_11475 [Aulosira sp. DedQUE10]|nr:hypothetical protein [Aulosira sp. DedQUE10]